ncbi:hypothetical protein Lfu02_62580 [Longispora fulva]|uniref:ABC-2 type transport system ATP-binding protein n=1 Tax=Longispora fulva TaxID=619741 RepID=A0A8J7GF33_9ACTN|nr:ATP-binding cassette domain-containing protein [Longispora fulva]MBG6134678.1 ABC-2 type transport system ATP-binding protein [Longispora fulva]GIG61886.1 hypothetical protein Lfu02_62580 [Longispora fulva]
MAEGRIVVSELTKRFGADTVVDHLSFTAEPGRVTCFLGPNGAGKTTTLKMLLNLTRPTSGTATIGGITFTEMAEPLRSVGVVLESAGAHPGRTGRDHLRVVAATMGLPDTRVDEVLDSVGLTTAARRRAGRYSQGMRQRLGIATALLGDPATLIFDEPTNGLDPAGVHWVRGRLRALADEGRTVLVSSHLLTEMEMLADDVVIIAAGRLVTQGPLDAVLDAAPAPDSRAKPGLESVFLHLTQEAEVR